MHFSTHKDSHLFIVSVINVNSVALEKAKITFKS